MDTVPQNVISGSSCTRKNLRDIAVFAQAKMDLKGVFAGPATRPQRLSIRGVQTIEILYGKGQYNNFTAPSFSPTIGWIERGECVTLDQDTLRITLLGTGIPNPDINAFGDIDPD